MRVNCLLATHHYFEYTGSETYLLTLAQALRALGHRPYLYSPYLGGAVARETRRLGIAVADRLDRFAGVPFEVAHVSHNLTAYQVRRAYPDLPMVFVSHGVVPFLEQPPVANLNIFAFVAVSEEVAENLAARGIPRADIRIVRNFVDTERFRPGAPIAPRPRRALILSYRMDGDTEERIRRAASKIRMRVRRVGRGRRLKRNVIHHIRAADLCITGGRGVLEAMACGRAVIVHDYRHGDGMITRENVSEIATCNFSGRKRREPFDEERWLREFAAYRPEMGAENRRIVEERFSVKGAAEELTALYREAIDRFRPVALDARRIAEVDSLIATVRSGDLHTLYRPSTVLGMGIVWLGKKLRGPSSVAGRPGSRSGGPEGGAR